MRILVCGDRNWNDQKTIERALQLWNATEVVQGECRGADLLGKAAAQTLNIPVLCFPANWEKYGRAAGPKRNQQMLDEGAPDLVLAFHNDIEHSKGTKDMIDRARLSGVKVMLYTEGSI